MILVNNTSSRSRWDITFQGGELHGEFDAGKYHRVDNLPGNPPYVVGFTCAGIEGVKSKDAIVSFNSTSGAGRDGVKASYPE